MSKLLGLLIDKGNATVVALIYLQIPYSVSTLGTVYACNNCNCPGEYLQLLLRPGIQGGGPAHHTCISVHVKQ
jgi:hypothetical protein